ncbi:MAG: sulfite exporter TauE/SafE family protein [Algisphaera sp.]
MSALIVTVFTASLLGSLHCVGMCGAFLAFALGDTDPSNPPTSAQRWRRQAAYHGGRGITYVLLGVAAGTAGKLLDLGGALAGLQTVAMPLAGLTIIGFGLATLLRHHGVGIKRLHPPAAWSRLIARGHGAAMKLPPESRALAIGLLTTLLPCGWLYAFAVTAAGTASPSLGALTMFAFWAGTLPALVSLGVGFQHLLGPLGRRLPTATCLLMIAVGLYTLLGRGVLNPAALAASLEPQGQTESQRIDQLGDANATCPACEIKENSAK